MALMRNLPDAHPLYKLLRPHVRYTMAINTVARESLLGHNGSISKFFSIGSVGQDQLFLRSNKRYSVHWSNIKRNIKDRGVDNTSQLPGYHYRDDGIKVWNAIEAYVSHIINQFYADDAAVSGDKELQYFAEDVHTNGFPGYGENAVDGRDFPRSITTKAGLIEIITLIMFTGSAQHAAVNFGQYDHYGFTPNSPFVLHLPPPTKKGEITYEQLMKALPNEDETQQTIGLIQLLSAYGPDEVNCMSFLIYRCVVYLKEHRLCHIVPSVSIIISGLTAVCCI